MAHEWGTALLRSQSKYGVRHIEQLEFIPTVDTSFITVRLFEVHLNIEIDSQCMYNVTVRRVRVTNFAVGNQ